MFVVEIAASRHAFKDLTSDLASFSPFSLVSKISLLFSGLSPPPLFFCLDFFIIIVLHRVPDFIWRSVPLS